jgi:branched-chain amino acid transport system permease protein
VCLIMLGGLAAFLKWTSYGVQMRAASENFPMARFLGVRANSVITLAFAISGLLAAVLALLVVVKNGVLDYRMGVPFVLVAFVATVIGGMGSLLGAATGGFLIGFVTVILQAFLPEQLRPARDAFVFGSRVQRGSGCSEARVLCFATRAPRLVASIEPCHLARSHRGDLHSGRRSDP